MTKRPNDMINTKKLKRRSSHHQEQFEQNHNQTETQKPTTTATTSTTIDPSSEQTSNINLEKPNCSTESSSSGLGSAQITFQPLKELSLQITTDWKNSEAEVEQQTATAAALLSFLSSSFPSPSSSSSTSTSSLASLSTFAPPLDKHNSKRYHPHRELDQGNSAIPGITQTVVPALTATASEGSTTKTSSDMNASHPDGAETTAQDSSSFFSPASAPSATAAPQVLSFSSRRKPKRKVLQPSLDCLLVTALFSTIFLMVGNFQIGGVTANSLMGSKHEPMFISRSETFKFVASQTIVLPCEVANTDSYVVAWKRGIAILTAGSVKVTPDPRVRLINGYNLQIRDAVPQDAGDYICQIATMEPREITHTVEILVPPRIHHISTGEHLQVKKGSSVRIECSASGNPTPNVTWSRKNNILPNGEGRLHSHILSIENVDRHKGGVYICTANNGVGEPASSQVVLHVLYPPEISVERPTVFSGEGHEAMLVCIVHGETQPEVIWFKDTMQLDTTERHIMENRGSRHTLIIRKVHPQDFGNYSCVAENQLGKSRKTLQLSGKPNVAVFNSPPISQYKDRYNISWTVDSYSPVEEFKLSFRRLPQGHEVVVDNAIEQSHSLQQSNNMMQIYNGGGGRFGSGLDIGNGGGSGHHRVTSGYGIHWSRNDWRDVVLPAMPLSHHYTQGMSYMIRALEPDQHYEATVQARNRYGWSDLTHSFLFSTSSNDGLIDLSSFLNHGSSDNEMRDLSVTFYGGSADTAKAFSKLSLLCVPSILILLMTPFMLA